MTTRDQQLAILASGQADWDADLDANFAQLEKGYCLIARAGAAVNTGHVLWMNSGEFFFHFDPKSESIRPMAFALTAASSGDSVQALLKGNVRSLGINSAVFPGQTAYVSVLTPGVIVGSYSGANREVGYGIGAPGIHFDPSRYDRFPNRLTSSLTISAVINSLHLFTADAGRYGWNMQTAMISSSADLVELKFYADAAMSTLLYATRSGGVSTVGSFQDRAGWPYENTDVTTYTGALYGTLKIMSGAQVTSNAISIQNTWDRSR